jgi:nicotinate-nucleotide adenylyltransferase
MADLKHTSTLDVNVAPFMLKLMRLGVFGGSFDPVHFGHLLLADCCWRQAALDRVVFVPASRQPHKPRAPRATDAQRVAMLDVATRERTAFEVSTIEIDRGGVSYTIDTLRELRAREPAARLFFLMGADSLADLPNWREPAEICRLATPLVVHRAGRAEPDFEALASLVPPARLAGIRDLQVDMPATPIASSEIQRLIAAGGDWRPLVPRSVADYIVEHRLYLP